MYTEVKMYYLMKFKNLFERLKQNLQAPSSVAVDSQTPQRFAAWEERGKLLEVSNQFVLFELQRINEMLRLHLLGDEALSEIDQKQTRASFEYQWADFNTGVAMANDTAFMSQIKTQVCQFTDLPAEWFKGKKIADVGCDSGRYSYAMLSLGASVRAFDQSESGLRNATKLCADFSDRFSTEQINLLDWSGSGDFDLVFCFGVVHHTGNTYLAMRNVADKVKPGGKLFLMIYGFPEKEPDFTELNSYESLRHKLRPLTFEEKKKSLIDQFGEHLAHGWFDAVAPRINDILTYAEIVEFLTALGFSNFKRTVKMRNHHLVAEKKG